MNDLKTAIEALSAIDYYTGKDSKCQEWRDAFDKLRNTLSRMIETPAPQGLPSEPTEEIINAIHDAISGDTEGYDGQQMDWYAKIYKSMLSAAPTPAPTEKVERIEGLEDAVKNVKIATAKGLVHPVETTNEGRIFYQVAKAQLKLQSGETEKVDLDALKREVNEVVCYRGYIHGDDTPQTYNLLKIGVEKAIDHLANTGRLR